MATTTDVEKLARKRIGYDISRWGAPEPYPAFSPAGPMVALTNEQAGSGQQQSAERHLTYDQNPAPAETLG